VGLFLDFLVTAGITTASSMLLAFWSVQAIRLIFIGYKA
jgi:hypothetical protein